MSDASSTNPPLHLAVIGGGITGLTAAYRLTKLLPQANIQLFEASKRLGGVLWTQREENYLVERGADSFLLKLPWAVDLCKELGLEDQIVPTNEGHRRALVVRKGQLHHVPEGFVVMRPNRLGPVLRSPLLSWRAKLRLLRESSIPVAADLDQPDYDESVASFAIRRLGQETFEQLVQPLLAGIYTADPQKLSLAATMPAILEDERKHGSLRKAAKAKAQNSETQASGARYASFVSLQGGLQQLIDSLVANMPPDSIQLNSAVQSIQPAANNRWTVTFSSELASQTFDGVIVALPAPRTAQIVSEVDQSLGQQLQSIPYASSAVVSFLLDKKEVSKPLEGFGIVVPTVEGMDIVAASFSSIKFPNRAPDDQLLVRVFLGGALRPEMVEFSDSQLEEISARDLTQLIGLQGKPTPIDVVRWREKMPQYHVGHVQKVTSIEANLQNHQGLELAGNAYHGVGIPQCVRSGQQAATRLAELLL